MLTPVTDLLAELKAKNISTMDLADQLGVVPTTVGRWLRGETFPQPEVERAIRHLYTQLTEDGSSQFALLGNTGDDSVVRSELKRALRELRESLHRHSRVTSRHELLDQLCLLLLSHIIDIQVGGGGIVVACPKATPVELKAFVGSVFTMHLPTHISTEIAQEDFTLRLKDSEISLAREIVHAFRFLSTEHVRDSLLRMQGIDVLNDVFGEFLAGSFADEKELGQYLTPPEIVRFMVRTAFHSLSKEQIEDFFDLPQSGSLPLVLDPSCGVGSFLVESLRFLRTEAARRLSGKDLARWHEAVGSNALMGIDKSDRMVRLSLCNMAMFGIRRANMHAANSLQWGRTLATQIDLHDKARLIITNPPFGAEFTAEELVYSTFARSRASHSNSKVDSELLFIERYIEWLEPGGHLLAIVPDSVLTNRAAYEALRAHVWQRAQILNVISLPQVTFAAAGTSTKTSILHFKKSDTPTTCQVYFAVADYVGYDVVTRGSQRRRVSTPANDLPGILDELCMAEPERKGVRRVITESDLRWDATYHSSKAKLSSMLENRGDLVPIRVRDVARLRGERTNPARRSERTFPYIEISDIESSQSICRCQITLCTEAPSRARNVVRPGDVLVSTVRPDQKKIGVVPSNLVDGVCSTGIAVLVPESISPLLLAKLLRDDFVTDQLLMNNTGIAYPTFNESVLLDIILPIQPELVLRIGEMAQAVWNGMEMLAVQQEELTKIIEASSFAHR
ncbi:MAG: N-6 DNA methylase [Fimbriimonadaceae bacterium]